MANLHINRNGSEIGIWSEEDVQARYATGELLPTDFYWTEGMAEWKELGTFIKPPIPPAVAAPVPPPASPPPVVAGRTVSNLATWTLVCGCVSLLCSFVTAIPAIILGHLALSEIKKNPGLQGRGMALAGLIIGYVMMACVVLYIGVAVLIALGQQVKDVQAAAPSSSETTTNSPSSQ